MTKPILLDPTPSRRGGSPSIRFRQRRGARRVHGVGLVRGGAETTGARGLVVMLTVVVLLVMVTSAAIRGAAPLSAAERAEIAAKYANTAPTAEPSAVPEDEAPADDATPVGELARTFATVEGVELGLPSPNVLLVGFHEAASRWSLPLTPQGRLFQNENTNKVTAPLDVEDGPGYLVLSSRGRRAAGTSAVDIVLRDGEPVLAPVSGTVVEVGPYALYGRYPDHRLVIRPDANPNILVTLIHIQGVSVTVGQQIEAGVTQIAAGPNRFNFTSHIDRYFPTDRWPHVHIETKHA